MLYFEVSQDFVLNILSLKKLRNLTWNFKFVERELLNKTSFTT